MACRNALLWLEVSGERVVETIGNCRETSYRPLEGRLAEAQELIRKARDIIDEHAAGS